MKNILIPIPPEKKQFEIAQTIKQIRSESKNLLEQANDILIEAKLNVEQMILGN